MFNKDTQYINIIRTEQNLKIDYQVHSDNKIIKSEQSIFLLDANNHSSDSKIKLKALENTNAITYISTLCEDENQIIEVDDENENDDPFSQNIYFDSKHSISLDNSKVMQYKSMYNNGEIDYLLSPYSILHNILAGDLHSKSLNILVLNNKLYSIVLDEEKRLSYSCIKLLTPYEEITDSSFFEDEISRQKLYEEMYILELQTLISDIMNNFYVINKNSYFIENINIYYNIKQLNAEQINTLGENLMLEVSYNQISIDNIIYELIKKKSVSKINYIEVRKKKSSSSKVFFLIIVLLLSFIVAAGVFYYKQIEADEKMKEEMILNDKKVKNEIIKEKMKEIALPNHKIINEDKIKFIVNLFDTVGLDSVLKEIQFQKNESTIVYNFSSKDSYDINFKPKLLKIYENSENILTSEKNGLFTSIISNTKIRKQNTQKSTKLFKPNKEYKFLNNKEAKKYIHTIINNAIVSSRKTYTKKYSTFTYNIITTIKTPQEFYEIINNLNNQYYSIELDYPIEFTKNNDKLKVSFGLKFNQIKKN